MKNISGITHPLNSFVSAIALIAVLSFSSFSFAAESPKDNIQVASVQAPININTADASSLALLNGVGDKKAELIIAYRETNGKFSSVDDLLNVKGIGEKTLSKNRSMLSVN